MAIEIVDLPIKNGVFFHSYVPSFFVSLPEGTCSVSAQDYRMIFPAERSHCRSNSKPAALEYQRGYPMGHMAG